MSSLLVVDDEPSILQLFRRAFEPQGISVLTAATGEEGIKIVRDGQTDTVMLDVLLPDKSGLDVLREIQEMDARLPVVFITAGSTSDAAIEAMKLGALDYLIKPLDLAKVRALVTQALEIRRLMREPVEMIQTPTHAPATGDVLVGQCQAIQEVYKAIGRVASQNVTVLIRGESGTGKELVARALYHHSDRSTGPFMAVNCAAIPEALLESELFGHERGSFTGADRQRIGKFEQCSGGTLFLDEIGDMSPPLQSKMLRVLQEQEFERVGGNKPIKTDVRIIAATNRDLEGMLSENRFRSDLYYRLNGFTIQLPSLRERGDDLLLLINHFLSRANRETNKDVQRVAPAAMDILKHYTWPGNIRELQSVIKQAILQTTGPVLMAEFLPASVRGTTVLLADQATTSTPASDPFDLFVEERLQTGTESLYDEAIARIERRLLSMVLQHTAGNQVEAARILGLTRTTLRTKIQKLGIKIDRLVHSDES
jgi:two-component system nitrogen regulation response regulator GlnG